MNQEKLFGMRDKLGYILGDFGNDFTFILSTVILMKFYTDVMGISAGAVGAIMMIARFVINPLTGTLGELGIILEQWQTGLVYLVLLMSYSLLSGWFVDKCTAAWKRKRQRTGKGEAE